MAVHINEMHTDVRPAAAAEGTGHTEGPTGRTEEERWRESRGRTEWLCHRTAAEGFDD
jgi:hypothetical protein